MRSANLHQLDGTGRGFMNPLDQSFGNPLIPKFIDKFHIIFPIKNRDAETSSA
jgi:hypothetical protein